MKELSTDQIRKFLKATLPIIPDMDLDAVINADLYLAHYISEALKSDDVTISLKNGVAAMIVAMFDSDTIQYLEHVIEDFYNEGIFLMKEEE